MKSRLCCACNTKITPHSVFHEFSRSIKIMTDRRPFNPNVTVPKKGGGEQSRSRNDDGRIREKRSDAGKPRK